MPIKVYREHFISNPKTKVRAIIAPLSVSTGMYMEMELAVKLGLTLEAYRRLPRKERKAWLFYTVLSNAKEKFAYDEAREKSEQEARFNSQASNPQNRFR